MGRKSGKSHRQRVAAQRREERGRFVTEHQMASFFWRLICGSWMSEYRAGCDMDETLDVLSLALHVREGEWALGTRGPRLGQEAAPWDSFPGLERVREWASPSPVETVQRWPSPPAGFKGSLLLLPNVGVGAFTEVDEEVDVAARLHVTAAAGVKLHLGVVSTRVIKLRLDAFSTFLHAAPGDNGWPEGHVYEGINWRSPGVSHEQLEEERAEAVERAASFRAHAEDMDWYDLGRKTVGSEEDCDSSDCSAGCRSSGSDDWRDDYDEGVDY